MDLTKGGVFVTNGTNASAGGFCPLEIGGRCPINTPK